MIYIKYQMVKRDLYGLNIFLMFVCESSDKTSPDKQIIVYKLFESLILL